MFEAEEVPGEGGRERLIILGGGLAGLATAFELTQQPDWRARFESITLYQMGWRLGGKCASSRGPHGRIEEHGIHAFLGSYHNSLPMMMAAYDELARTRPGRYPDFEAAFVAQDSGQIWEREGRTASPWPRIFPKNSRGIRDERRGYEAFELCMVGFAELLLSLLAAKLGALLTGTGGSWLVRLLRKPIEKWALKLGLRLARKTDHPRVAAFHRFWRRTGQGLFYRMTRGSAASRREFVSLDHLLVLVCGVFAEQAHVKGFDHFDDQDFHDWLKAHGAHEETLKSPLNISHANITYQYPRGDTSRPPSMAAGCYARWALLSTRYFGSYIWRFAAGSGETLIAPLYEVLKDRGVVFEFFHKVRDVKVDGSRIAAVDFDVQAETKAGPYEPLVEVRGWPSWPDRPHYDQLEQGEAMQRLERRNWNYHGRLDLESYWSGWSSGLTKTLEAGRDFDKVVFAISVGAVKYLCPDLMKADARWAAMPEGIPTHATQHMQIWVSKTPEELGWSIAKPPGDAIITTTYLNPFNQHVEFRDLIDKEDWPDDNRPKGLWYFSGLLMDDEQPWKHRWHTYPKRQHDRVKYQAIQYLKSAMGQLLPLGTPAERLSPGDMFGFDFELLVCPDETGAGKARPRKVGMDRFDGQFWRANIDPTERYVACPPGNTAFRLKAWDSGFDNLAVAGDWIYTGINVGSVEGAIMGGRLASHALTGSPPLKDIVGYPLDIPSALPSASQLARLAVARGGAV